MKKTIVFAVLYILAGIYLTEMTDLSKNGLPYISCVIFLPIVSLGYGVAMMAGALLALTGAL